MSRAVKSTMDMVVRMLKNVSHSQMCSIYFRQVVGNQIYHSVGDNPEASGLACGISWAEDFRKGQELEVPGAQPATKPWIESSQARLRDAHVGLRPVHRDPGQCPQLKG